MSGLRSGSHSGVTQAELMVEVTGICIPDLVGGVKRDEWKYRISELFRGELTESAREPTREPNLVGALCFSVAEKELDFEFAL
jgi:hypothetical protein